MFDVVVIGGANVDIKAKVEGTYRLGTSNPGQVSMTLGGVGRNIAHNLAAGGNKVTLISALGTDMNGDWLLSQTEAAGVDMALVHRSARPTGTYIATLDSDGELVSAVSDMSILETIDADYVAGQAVAIQNASFIVADCNLPIGALQYLARNYGEKLLIEPVSVAKSAKLVEALKAGPAFAATPNLDQIDSLFGSRDIETAITRLHALGLANVIIHAGSEGAFVSDGVTIDHVEPDLQASVVDVTGAGDAALAGLVHGLLRKQSLAAAAAHGQHLAGQVIASTRSTLG